MKRLLKRTTILLTAAVVIPAPAGWSAGSSGGGTVPHREPGSTAAARHTTGPAARNIGLAGKSVASSADPLDRTFGNGGVVTRHGAAGGNGTDYGLAVAVAPDGDVLVAGYSRNGRDNDMALWRFNRDGTPDTAFGGGDGVVVHQAAAGRSGHDRGHAVAVAPDGDILVAGESQGPAGSYMALWRFHEDGSPDTAFGRDAGRGDGARTGYVTRHNAAGGDFGDSGYAVALDAASGDILVAGSSWNGTDYDMVLWRFHPDGTPDRGFGGDLDGDGTADGYLVHHSAAGGDGADQGYAVAVDGQGRILVTGVSYGSSRSLDMALWRFHPDGSPDIGFGNGDGIVTDNDAAGGNGYDLGHAVAVAPNGDILVAGYSHNATDYDMALWRFRDDGSPDIGFGGGDGIVTHHGAAGGDSHERGHSVAVAPDGGILVAGESRGHAGYHMALWRFHEDGTLDDSFGDDANAGDGTRTGYVTRYNAAEGGFSDYGHAVTVEAATGAVLVAGRSWNGSDYDMALWRFDRHAPARYTASAEGAPHTGPPQAPAD